MPNNSTHREGDGSRTSVKRIQDAIAKDGFEPPQLGETQSRALRKIADYIDFLHHVIKGLEHGRKNHTESEADTSDRHSKD